jgi:hypothetical protein
MNIIDKRSCKLLDTYHALPNGTWFVRNGNDPAERICLKLVSDAYCSIPKFDYYMVYKNPPIDFKVVEVTLTVTDHPQGTYPVRFSQIHDGGAFVSTDDRCHLKTSPDSWFSFDTNTWNCFDDLPARCVPVSSLFSTLLE